MKTFEEMAQEETAPVVEDKVSLAQRTLITKLYEIEQEMEVFKIEFPNEYRCYLEKIQNLRDTPRTCWAELQQGW